VRLGLVAGSDAEVPADDDGDKTVAGAACAGGLELDEQALSSKSATTTNAPTEAWQRRYDLRWTMFTRTVLVREGNQEPRMRSALAVAST
jgi:hypothetical protein